MRKLFIVIIFIFLCASFGTAQDKCPQAILDACVQTANELAAARTLIEAQRQEIAALKERLLLEQQRSSLYKEMSDIRELQKQDLIAIGKLKDEIIVSQREQIKLSHDTIVKLLSQKESFWSRVGKEVVKVGIIIGAGAILTR